MTEPGAGERSVTEVAKAIRILRAHKVAAVKVQVAYDENSGIMAATETMSESDTTLFIALVGRRPTDEELKQMDF